MAFDGWGNTPDCLRIASALVTAPPFSMSAWAIPSSFAFDRRVVCVCNSASGVNLNQFFLGFEATTGTVHCAASDGSGSNRAQSTAGATAGQWNHLGGVWASATDRRAYLNGANKGTASTSKVPSGLNRTSIGLEDNAAKDAGASGPVAHVAIWSVALTDAEIAALGKGFSPLLVRRDALLGYWPLLADGSSAIKNVPMTLVGAVAKSSTKNPPIIMPRRKLLLDAA